MKPQHIIGRFAPSPSGRMHLGNVFTALVSWLSVRSRSGKWILRIEDLDPQRSKSEYSKLIEDDLNWLGLNWDEGGIDNIGSNGPYCQSLRSRFYASTLNLLNEKKLLYPCTCSRNEILSTQAPHQTDGRIVYAGTCRPCENPPFYHFDTQGHNCRIWVPDETVSFLDKVYGEQTGNLAGDCGDFILCRADGAWAYQLAVVIDDGLMGVNEVVRGNDLLLSTFQQIYLYRLLGFECPTFAHIPLICNKDGKRLSKRDKSLSLETIRKEHTPAEILGYLAYLSGIIPKLMSISADDLALIFDWRLINPTDRIIIQ